MKKYNFNAGPSILPREVIENTAKQILDFNGSGLSLAEISHRAKDFQPVIDEAVALIKELLNVPEGYSVLFLGGGASLEFCMVPYNFLIKKAAYLNTGVWAKKAMKEAKLFGEVVEVASSADANFTFIPKGWTCPDDVEIPTMLNYQTHVEKGSMFNTPPVVPIYTALENLRWIKKMGGVEAMDKLAHERADIVYSEIDRNKLFRGTVNAEDRSLMNICFVMNEEYAELEKPFLEYATSQGMNKCDMLNMQEKHIVGEG